MMRILAVITVIIAIQFIPIREAFSAGVTQFSTLSQLLKVEMAMDGQQNVPIIDLRRF